MALNNLEIVIACQLATRCILEMLHLRYRVPGTGCNFATHARTMSGKTNTAKAHEIHHRGRYLLIEPRPVYGEVERENRKVPAIEMVRGQRLKSAMPLRKAASTCEIPLDLRYL